MAVASETSGQRGKAWKENEVLALLEIMTEETISYNLENAKTPKQKRSAYVHVKVQLENRGKIFWFDSSVLLLLSAISCCWWCCEECCYMNQVFPLDNWSLLFTKFSEWPRPTRYNLESMYIALTVAMLEFPAHVGDCCHWPRRAQAQKMWLSHPC